MLRRLATAVVVACLFVGFAASRADADPGKHNFVNQIALPDGFGPEGIASGPGTTFYVGSIPTGAVYRGDVRTGDGAVLVPGGADRAAVGLKEDDGVLYVAGGPTGMAFLYDASTGADIAQVTLTTDPTFINDVVVTKRAAFFTDSVNPFVYRVDRDTLVVTPLPLTGDLVYEAGFNVNGIDATRNGGTLVVVQSNTGKLFTVDPNTGVTNEIVLEDGESVPSGDGILLEGNTLYVVQNFLNQITTIELEGHDLTSGEVESVTTNPLFDVPTTIARFGNRLYAVNARFSMPPEPDTTYDVIGLRRPRT